MNPSDNQSTSTELLVPVAPDVEYQQSTVRRDEWNLYLKGLKVVDAALDRLLENPRAYTSLSQLARLLETVNRIRRGACGLGFDAIEHRVSENAEFMIEVDAILQRVFSKPESESTTQPAAET